MKQNFPEQEFLSYNVDYRYTMYPVEVKGFDSMVEVIGAENYRYKSQSELRYPYLLIDADKSTGALYVSTGVTEDFTLKFAEKLYDSATLSRVNNEDLRIKTESKGYDIVINLSSLTLRNPKYVPSADTSRRSTLYSNINGFALIKKK